MTTKRVAVSIVPFWEMLWGKRKYARFIDTSGFRIQMPLLGEVTPHDIIYLALTVLWLASKVISTSAYNGDFSWFRLSTIAFVPIILNDVLTGRHSRGSILLFLLLGICAANSYRLNDTDFGMNLFVVFCARDIEFEKVLRVAFWTGLVCVAGTVVCCKMGYLKDVTVSRGSTVRHSWGFGYATFLSHYYLNLMLAYFYLRRKKYGYSELLLAFIIDYAIYYTTDSRNSFLLALGVLLALLCSKFLKRFGINETVVRRIIGIVAPFSFVLCAVLSAALLLWVPVRSTLGQRLNNALSTRLELSQDAFETYPVTPLGIEVHFTGWTDQGDGYLVSGFEENDEFIRTQYTYVDSSYLQLLIRHGWLPFATLLGLLTVGTLWFVSNGEYLGAFFMSVFALHSVLDPQLAMVNYCFLLFCMCRKPRGLFDVVRRRDKLATIGWLLVSPIVTCMVVVLSALINYGFPLTIDSNAFTDQSLCAYVAQKVDANGDGKLSKKEASRLTSISIQGVKELSGLGVFPNLNSVEDTDEELERADLSGMTSLSRVNFAGAKNLVELNLSGDDKLASIYVRGTGLDRLDLSDAASLGQLSCDSDLEVTGAKTATWTNITSLDAIETDAAGNRTGEYHLEASYDERGRLKRRELTASDSISIDYTYDDQSRVVQVAIDSDEERLSNVWNVEYGDDGLSWHAIGTNGTRIDKLFDELGRPTMLDVDVEGLDGRITGTLAYEYNGYGMLSSITATDSSGTSSQYSLLYKTDGSLRRLSSSEDSYTYEGLREAIWETHGDETSLYEWQRSGKAASAHWTTSDGETVGAYHFEGTFSFPVWGSTTRPDGSNITFRARCEIASLPMDIATHVSGTVDYANMADLTLATDYYLPEGDLSWVVENEAHDIAAQQNRSRMYTGVVSYYDDEVFKYYDRQYAPYLSQILADTQEATGSSCKYAYYDIDGDGSSEMLVSEGTAENIVRIYTLVDEQPYLCRVAAEGETLRLSSQGYLVVLTANAQTLERYNGIGFDTLAVPSEANDLASLYPALSGLGWHDWNGDE